MPDSPRSTLINVISFSQHPLDNSIVFLCFPLETFFFSSGVNHFPLPANLFLYLFIYSCLQFISCLYHSELT